MRKLKDGMTRDQVVGAYQGAVEDFKNQISRVPARTNSPEDVEAYSVKLFNEDFKGLLHPYVLDQYKA